MTPDRPAPSGHVAGADGTSIAFWRSGEPSVSRRPLVLVHGTTSDHRTFDELLPYAAADRAVYTYDRRGRGGSGDGANDLPYAIESEFADARAVFAEAARAEGTDVDVLAHSFGAFVALGALPGIESVHAAAVYSPGFGAAYPPGALDRLEAAVASDDLNTALRLIFREIIGMADSDIDVLQESPVWEVRTELAWSVARECRADQAYLADQLPVLRSVDVPVLVITGATNTPEKKAVAARIADAVPGATHVELAGQGHTAHHSAPAALLRAAGAFLDRAGGDTTCTPS